MVWTARATSSGAACAASGVGVASLDMTTMLFVRTRALTTVASKTQSPRTRITDSSWVPIWSSLMNRVISSRASILWRRWFGRSPQILAELEPMMHAAGSSGAAIIGLAPSLGAFFPRERRRNFLPRWQGLPRAPKRPVPAAGIRARPTPSPNH